MEENSASTSYQKAKASVEKATGKFKGVQTIGAKDILRLREEGKKVLLVDVRTEEEMKVSMLRGALTREGFESSRLGEPVRTGGKFQEYSGEEDAFDVVVPYCTAGYRSGQYAKKLIDLGYPSVRNSEGVVLWTHDIGNGLVTKAAPDAVGGQDAANIGSGNDAGNGAEVDARDVEVKRVHVYAPPWDHAREDFETVTFTPTGCRVGSAMRSAFSKIFRTKK